MWGCPVLLLACLAGKNYCLVISPFWDQDLWVVQVASQRQFCQSVTVAAFLLGLPSGSVALPQGGEVGTTVFLCCPFDLVYFSESNYSFNFSCTLHSLTLLYIVSSLLCKLLFMWPDTENVYSFTILPPSHKRSHILKSSF